MSSTKRLTAARLAGVPELELAFNDWTDTYDIHDGMGERAPDSGPHVVVLQESLLAMGYALPTGADGVYGPATTAAVIRLQIDAGHPWAPGNEWEHIGGIAGPNTLAHFDMFDPGETVATSNRIATGVAASSVSFAASPDNPFAGFDGSVSPPALTVGTSTRRRLQLRCEPPAAELELVVSDPEVAFAGWTDEGVVVGGRKAGHATLVVRSLGQPLAELAITVRDPREEVVNVFLVSIAGAPERSTARTLEHATLHTLRLNRVWRRQANVHFTLGSARALELPALDGPAALAPFAVAGQLNVFCVAGPQPETDSPSLVLLADEGCPDGMDLAHAAGHFLGFAGEHPATGVMSTCAHGADRAWVPGAVAEVVNP